MRLVTQIPQLAFLAMLLLVRRRHIALLAGSTHKRAEPVLGLVDVEVEVCSPTVGTQCLGDE